MEIKNILALSFFAISIVLILVGSINVFDGYITGKVTGSSSVNITSIGGFGELLDAGLISTSGDCESLGALQNANLISEDGEKKLHHGTVEFSEEDCQADISELIKNDRQIEVEGVSVSREKGADSYMLEATSEDKEGFVNVDGKKVYLKKGDSIKLDSENGKIEKGSFSVKESTNFDFGPLSANIDEGEVNYNSNDKMLKLPSGSEIEMIDATELNNIMGESNTFDINGEDIEMSSNVYNGIVSFSPQKAGKFRKFSGNLRLNKPILKESGMDMKYIASIPNEKSLSFPEAGVSIEASEQSESYLFFENKETWNIQPEDEPPTLGSFDYKLRTGGREISTLDYVSLTDNEISGYSAGTRMGDSQTYTKINLDNADVAGFQVSENQHLQTNFGPGKFSLRNGEIHASDRFSIENGQDKLMKSSAGTRLDILGGEPDKKPVKFNVYVKGEKESIIKGVVGDSYKDKDWVYSSSFSSSEDYSSDFMGEDYREGVTIVHTDGSRNALKESIYRTDKGNVGISTKSDFIPEKFKEILRRHIQRNNP